MSIYYAYEGGRLMSHTKYNYKHNNYVVVEKSSFKYSDGRLSGCTYMIMPNFLDSLIPYYEYTYKYNNGKLIEISYERNTNYDGEMSFAGKREFAYTGDNLTSIKSYTQMEDKLLLVDEETFYYDADGYLIMSVPSHEGYKFSYKYEPGKGNGALFNDPLNVIYGIPDIIR